MKLLSSMSCPYKMRGPCRNPTKWVAVLIFLLHMLQKVWPPDCAGYICEAAFIHCLFPRHAPTKWGNSYNTVWCFVISCAYSHIAEDTPREVFKIKFEFKLILGICVVFLFPRPPSCHIMPLQMTGFLPSTYSMGWRCGSLFFSQTCNLRL